MRPVRAAALALTLFAAPRAAMALGFGQGHRQDGGQPGQFLQASAGARPLSMGGAHTAIADDATAPFWNASGLAQIQRFDLVTYYSRLGVDANIGAGAFALPTRRFGTFGINAVSLRSGSFKRRDEQNRDLGSFENNASAYMLSQALNLNTRWSAGYTLKAIHEQIDTYGDTGYGADLGLLLRPHALWQFGLAVQNLVQPQLRLKNETERYPTEVRVGSRFEARPQLTLAADVSLQKDRAAELSLGTEWRVAPPLALRIGVNDREITAGMGVTAGDANVDYAFGMPHASVARDELGDTHRISFHLRFGTNVMAGSYRDLARRREEQRVEVVRVDRGVDDIKVLQNRMRTWNGRMDAQTFANVQAARGSLRQFAFRDPVKSIEAQAYITHFQGRFVESARLFEHAVEKDPQNRHLRQDAIIAHERARNHSNAQTLAAMYDRLDQADRQRHEQVALLPLPAPPMMPQRPAIERPAAPPVAKPVSSEPEAAPARTAPPKGEPVAVPARKEPAPPLEEPVAARVQPQAAPPTARPEVLEARRQFERGNYVSAHLSTKKILESKPDDRDAARQAMITNSVVAAQASITDVKQTVDVAALEQQVDQSLGLYDQGLGLYQNRRREDAAAVWEQSFHVCPANFLSRKMLQKIEEEKFNERWDRILPRSSTGPPS